jgi:hypothetical protein
VTSNDVTVVFLICATFVIVTRLVLDYLSSNR